MAWHALTLDVDGAHAESFSEALLEAGAVSVLLEDADAGTAAERPQYAEPDWDAATAWTRNRLRILLDAATDPGALLAQAAQQTGLESAPAYVVERVDDEDWVQRTREQFQPVRITASLWVVPTWCEPPDRAATNLRLDPGQAFGTGTHPTTKMVLQWLSALVPELRVAGRRDGAPLRVLDYGCGSGILAIAAAKLGAAHVDAVDIDVRALEATRTNARANGVSVNACSPDDLAPGAYDVIVANILANPLIALAPALSRRLLPDGHLALSGILDIQAQDVISAYAGSVFLDVAVNDGDWSLLVGRCSTHPDRGVA